LAAKYVLIVNSELPVGLALNCAAILGMSLGARLDGALGPDVPDRDGVLHRGLTQVPVPILTATSERLAALRMEAEASGREDLTVLDFTKEAQSSATYDLYRERLGGVGTADAEYCAVMLQGPRKLVDRLTRQLPLYR